MRIPALLVIPGVVLLLCAQDGPQPSRCGWPCDAGRPVDPAYLDISESTGGELFMFQRGEAGQSLNLMTAWRGHKATIRPCGGKSQRRARFRIPG
jgi:hypothetical protein